MLAQHASSAIPVILLLFGFVVISIVPLVLFFVLGFASAKVRNKFTSGHRVQRREHQYHQTVESVGSHPAPQANKGIPIFVMLFFAMMIPLLCVMFYAERVERTARHSTRHTVLVHNGDSSSANQQTSMPMPVPQTTTLQPQSQNAARHLPNVSASQFPQEQPVPAEDHASTRSDTIQPKQPSTPGFVAGTGSAKDVIENLRKGRPIWLEGVKNKNDLVISSQRFVTIREAQNQAYELAISEVRKRIKDILPESKNSNDFPISGSLLDQLSIKDRYSETFDVTLDTDLTAKMHRVHFLLDVSESAIRQYRPYWIQAEATERSWVVIQIGSVGFAMLAGLAMLLNVPYVRSRSYGVVLSLLAISAFCFAAVLIDVVRI